MAAEVKPIRTKRDYDGALKEIERLWGAKAGTPDGDRLDVLATLIDAYETEHHPMDPPDPIGDQVPHGAAGAPAPRSGRNHRYAHPDCGGSESKTRAVDRNDPPPAYARLRCGSAICPNAEPPAFGSDVHSQVRNLPFAKHSR